MKKLTKRQILNELLDLNEKQKKIYASRRRLDKRVSKLEDRRSELADQLADICRKGDGIKPIVYKKQLFDLTSGGSWYRASVDIGDVSNVK